MLRFQINRGGALVATIVLLLLLTTYIRERGKHRGHPDDLDNYTGEPRQDDWWGPLHDQLVQEYKSNTYDIIFYGDSITEAWRGTSAGQQDERYAANAKAFEATFNEKKGKKIKATAFGLAGDQTQHLLWRLHHGELTEEHPPSVAVVLIGTNNLGWARILSEGEDEEESISSIAPTVTKHILLILRRFHTISPSTKVLLVGLLPRGSGSGGGSSLEQPSVYSSALEEINQHMAGYASQDGRVGFVDCTEEFISGGKDHKGRSLDRTKIPDGLHPTGEGAKTLAECIKPALDDLLP